MTGERFCKLSMALASRPDLTGSDKVVLAIIIDRMGHNGKCWPGTRTLARESGLHRETVLECIGRLEGCGDLIVQRRGNGKGNHYALPDKSGREIRPVEKTDRSETPTGGGRKTRPEAVGNSDHNQTDQLNQTNKSRAEPDPDDATPFLVYLKEHPALDTPEFRKAWADWNTYRREAKKKLTKSTAKVQLKNLAAVGAVAAIQAIENSIGHGWQGLFPKDSTGNTSNALSNGGGFPAQREPTSEEADELLKGLDGFGTTAGGARA